MFTMGPVHTWNHGQGCSDAELKLDRESKRRGKGHIYMPIRKEGRVCVCKGAITALEKPGGPQVDLEDLVAQHFYTIVNIITN